MEISITWFILLCSFALFGLICLIALIIGLMIAYGEDLSRKIKDNSFRYEDCKHYKIKEF